MDSTHITTGVIRDGVETAPYFEDSPIHPLATGGTLSAAARSLKRPCYP